MSERASERYVPSSRRHFRYAVPSSGLAETRLADYFGGTGGGRPAETDGNHGRMEAESPQQKGGKGTAGRGMNEQRAARGAGESEVVVHFAK